MSEKGFTSIGAILINGLFIGMISLIKMLLSMIQIMIKFQQIEKREKVKERYICLSPFCYDPYKRIITDQSPHLKTPTCAKWITNQNAIPQNYKQPTKQTQYFQNKQNINLTFYNQPLKGLHHLYEFTHQDWKQYIHDEFQTIKKEINTGLDLTHQMVKQSIERLCKNAYLYQQIGEIITNNPQQKANLFLGNYLLEKHSYQLTELFQVSLFDKCKINKQMILIKQHVSQLCQGFFDKKDKKVDESCYQRSHQFYNFMFQPVDNIFGKLQTLSSAIGNKLHNYQIYGQTCSLRCFLCSFIANQPIVSFKKKDVKKQVAFSIIRHIYCQHYAISRWSFQHKISKSTIFEISLEKVLKQIEEYSNIHIIDRQSGVMYQQIYNQSIKGQGQFDGQLNKLNNTYTLEIITNKNIKIAKGRFITVKSRQAVEVIISILTYEISNKKKYVSVFTKTGVGQGIRQFFCQTSYVQISNGLLSKISNFNNKSNQNY